VSVGGTETVSLNLDGTFAPAAEKDAAAGSKLAAAFDRLAEAGAKVQQPGGGGAAKMSAITAELEHQIQLEAKIATFDAGRAKSIDALEKRYKSMKDAALGVQPKAAGGEGPVSFKGLEGMGGSSILGGAVALGAGATLAISAGKAILDAAIELGKSALELTAAGIKLSIEQSSKKALQDEVFKAIGGDYSVAVKLSAKYALEEDQGVAMVKKLLGAKFSQTEVEALIRVDVGIGAVLGEEKAKAFLEQIAKDKLKGGKASEETLKGFAEAGVDVEAVWVKLAEKMHTSVAVAKGKVKANLVDMTTVLDSVEDVAKSKFGGIADGIAGSVPALLLRIKSGFMHLFDGADLGPVKEFLGNLAGAVEGSAGQELKATITELFSAINHAFLDQFRGEEGKAKIEKFMRGAAAAIHELSDAVTTAKPLIEALTDQAGNGAVGGLVLLGDAIRGAAIMFQIFNDGIQLFLDGLDIIEGALGMTSDEANASGEAIGGGVVDGLVEGITGGAGRALAAAAEMAAGVLTTVRGVFDQHSPSAEFGDIGDNNALGLANAMNDNDAPARAGAAMASKALRAAQAANDASDVAGGGGAGGGGRGAGGGDTFIFQIQASGTGTTAEQGEEIADAAYRRWQEHQRRDARERAA
jgi:hypothetical protein